MTAPASLKKRLSKKYNMKDMNDVEDVKTIIGWQVIRDLGIKILKICQLIYIKNLLKKKNLINCNVFIILIKARSAINMNKLNDYIKTNLTTYQ